jgi:hypothetical protein
VKAVLFSVEANIAAIALHGTMAKLFFRQLFPLHTPPQNLPFMRIVRLLDLAFFREYKRLIDENVLWLGSSFASTNSDFYQCPERREAYGCIVANMCSKQYVFKDGRHLFVSQQTIKEGAINKLAITKGTLKGMETVISFKKFDGAKTGIGIGNWMAAEHMSKGLLPAFVGYHSTDGASNAVASANHYALLAEMNTDSPIQHDKCMAHQNNRSAKYASGTGDFKHCSNPELRAVLMKTHNLIARVHRSSYRVKVVCDVKAQKRTQVVLPVPSVVTRWDSSNLEVASLNRIMGDFNNALNLLIDGHDKKDLTNKEGDVADKSDYTFTGQEKTILRQFECGSQPCLMLSKFFQLNDATIHETLFVTVARVAQMRETSFTMFGDISHTDLPDLRKRSKTVVVVSSSHTAPNPSGREEQPMEECIELFRELYGDDMMKRCGITNDNGNPVPKLPVMIGMACLLNPIYGGKCCWFFIFWSSKNNSNILLLVLL